MFAGTTVVIALGGLFVLRLSFMNGLAIGAGITVITVMFTAVTLLPAVLSLLGRKAFAWRMPWARKPKASPGVGLRQVRRHLAEASVALRLAGTSFHDRFGDPHVRNAFWLPGCRWTPGEQTTRIAYDLTTEGFGAGANGPFLVVVEMPNAGSVPAANALSQSWRRHPGVATASPVIPGTPSVTPDGTTAIIQVQPTTGPQDQATSDLLENLRTNVIPTALLAPD